MANKKQRKALEQKRLEEAFKWPSLAQSTLSAPDAFSRIGLATSGAEIIPNFDGSPEGLFCWIILPGASEKSTARARSAEIEVEARRLLAEAGFPETALPSLRFDYTSRPEIDAAGGRFAFFR